MTIHPRALDATCWPSQLVLGRNAGLHGTAVYNILRHNGVEIGKRDYLGKA